MPRSDAENTLGSLMLRLDDLGQDPSLEPRLNAAFGTHVAWLQGLCRRELRGFGDQEVEEVVQDVLLTAWRRLPDYRGEGRFRTWLAGIARNQCRNRRRKLRDALTEDGVLDAGSPVASVLSGLMSEERDGVVRAAAEAVLNDEEQEIVEWRYVRELDRAQIAERAGYEDANRVRVVLQRCRRRLQAEIRHRLEELGHGASFLE